MSVSALSLFAANDALLHGFEIRDAILYRTLPQMGRLLTPQWRRQTAADSDGNASPLATTDY